MFLTGAAPRKRSREAPGTNSRVRRLAFSPKTHGGIATDPDSGTTEADSSLSCHVILTYV